MTTRFLSLYSGGTDSPVALYLMTTKGLEPIVIHFHFQGEGPIKNDPEKLKALVGLKILTKYTSSPIKVYLIPHSRVLNVYLEKNLPSKQFCVFCRRMMYRFAVAIGEKEGINILVTGEVLGEKASQTPQNMKVIEKVAPKMVVIRPCIALDKLQIEAIAKEIGTYESSIQKIPSCGSTPKYPETFAKENQIKEIEENLDIQSLVEGTFQFVEIIYF